MKYDETQKMKYDSRKCPDTIHAETLFCEATYNVSFLRNKEIER